MNLSLGKCWRRYEDSKGQALIQDNPIKRLSQTRAWYRVERRQTVIKPHELKPWFQAVMNLKNDIKSQNRETIRIISGKFTSNHYCFLMHKGQYLLNIGL